MQIIPSAFISFIIILGLLLVAFSYKSYKKLEQKEQHRLQVLVDILHKEKKIENVLKKDSNTIEDLEKSMNSKLSIIRVCLINIQFSLSEILH